jgi:hypothetical protein
VVHAAWEAEDNPAGDIYRSIRRYLLRWIPKLRVHCASIRYGRERVAVRKAGGKRAKEEASYRVSIGLCCSLSSGGTI